MNKGKLKSTAARNSLPDIGFVRLATVLRVFPISEAGWWDGIRAGLYPRGVKLSPRVTAWRVEDIRKLIADISKATP